MQAEAESSNLVMVTSPVTQLFERLRAGDQSVLNELVAGLYDELRLIAAQRLRAERSGHTLQTTALVHEAYLRLSGSTQRTFEDRAHFLAAASRVMRQALVDYATARATDKRGGDVEGAGNLGAPGPSGVRRLGLPAAAPPSQARAGARQITQRHG